MSRRMGQLVHRSLLPFAPFAIAFIMTAGLDPRLYQDDGKGQSCTLCQNCTLCKVGGQPTLLATPSFTVGAPRFLRSSGPGACEPGERQVMSSESATRAPPA